MPPILAYYINLVIGDDPEVTAVWHVTTLELVILALIRVLVVAERGAVGYYCCDPHMDHGCFGATTSISSGTRRRVYRYSFFQRVTGCSFELAGTNLAYGSSVEIDW